MFSTTQKDYTESIAALQSAIELLKKQGHDRAQSSLVQVAELASIPAEARKTIDLFLSQISSESDPLEAPVAPGYEFQSSGIVDMLKKLLGKFTDELTALEHKEDESAHQYELLIQELDAETASASEFREEKQAVKAKKLQAVADDGATKDVTTSTRDSEKVTVRKIDGTCGAKATDFEARQALRAEEIQAIEKAIEILSSDSVMGAAKEHLPSLLQRKPVSLAQIRTAGARSPTQARAVDFLRVQGQHLNSHVLSTLALRIADDPFEKVRQLIKDLIVRLQEEANSEAQHKSWCDHELATNEKTRKEKTEGVETLHAEVDELSASIQKLTDDLTSLTKDISDLDDAMAQATEIRRKEKAENEATIKDATAAQMAVSQALTVLKEFYAKSGEPTSMAQIQNGQPDIFESSYTGMHGNSKGVIGLLEVVQSDFARLDAETKAAEVTSAKAHDGLMTDSKVDKATKEKDVEYKTAKRQDQEQALSSTKKDLKATQVELDAAVEYFEKLKPSCVNSGSTFGERTARRQEEIESLQEALKILNGEA